MGGISLLLAGIVMAAASTSGFGAAILQPMLSTSGRGMQFGVFRMHWCGNARVEVREACDDGNRRSGDGCSRWCQVEPRKICDGKYSLGQRFPSPDGCNTCTCTVNGIACTLKACAPTSSSARSTSPSPSTGTKCLSSNQCPRGQYCTTEDGDCQSACEPGAMVCIQACAGVCRKRSCKPMVCPDGSSHPTCSADGHVINYFADPCMTSRRSSSATPAANRCDPKKREFEAVVSANNSCARNTDCMLFEQSCPYLTCGVAINEGGETRVRAAAESYVLCKQQSGDPLPCAGCVMQTVACENGRCVLRQ